MSRPSPMSAADSIAAAATAETAGDDRPRMQLGVDVGGTSIKGAIVDLRSGQLAGQTHNVQTPQGATPEQVAALVWQIAAAEGWIDGIGIALPGVISGSRLCHAPNLSGVWERDGALDCLLVSADAAAVLINDADAAGLAELIYGGPQPDAEGLTVVLTFGTGIGSALLHNGHLIPNSELGEITSGSGRFEDVASGRAISEHDLTPVQWAERAQPYFDLLETLLNPGRWVLGGGLTENFQQYASRLDLSKPVSVAHLGVHAGIVGAAAAVGRLDSASNQSGRQ